MTKVINLKWQSKVKIKFSRKKYPGNKKSMVVRSILEKKTVKSLNWNWLAICCCVCEGIKAFIYKIENFIIIVDICCNHEAINNFTVCTHKWQWHIRQFELNSLIYCYFNTNNDIFRRLKLSDAKKVTQFKNFFASQIKYL